MKAEIMPFDLYFAALLLSIGPAIAKNYRLEEVGKEMWNRCSKIADEFLEYRGQHVSIQE